MCTPCTTISIPCGMRPQNRTVALSEYGGIAWPMPGHEPPHKTYGYGTAKDRQELTARYKKLQLGTVLPQLQKGPFGAGVHPADRCGGRGERSVHLRPHRHQAGRQRRPFGERCPCRRVCKGSKIERLWRRTIGNGLSYRVAAPSIRFVPWAALASCWPLPQQLLPVSATGGGRCRCTLAIFSGKYILMFGAVAK